jgi:hypothetical protein
MKKILPLLGVLALSGLMACGGGNTSNQETENSATEETANVAGMKAYDLNQHGLPLSIMIPDESTGIAEVTPNELGGVDIRVGKNFGIAITFGDGDIALRKTDLQDDLVYESTIHTDEANLLVYERTIPGAGMEAEHHFYYTTTIGADVFDVQNLVGEPFGKAAIEKMVNSAKTLKAQEGA